MLHPNFMLIRKMGLCKMINNIDKLKNLMVASCDAIRKGNKDIGLNLLEVAADVMEEINPEDIEMQFVTAAPIPASAEEIREQEEEHEKASADDELEVDEEIASMQNHKRLHNILAGWDLGNGAAV